MVIPVIAVVVAWLSVPFIILNASFWALYQAMAHEEVWAQHQILVQVGIALLALGDAWAVSRCLFIFDWFNRPRSILVSRPLLATLLGTGLGVVYAALLLLGLHCGYPGDATMDALARPHSDMGWWLLVGAVQGAVLTLGTHWGLGFEVERTANLEPPVPTLIHGSLDNVMVPMASGQENVAG